LRQITGRFVAAIERRGARIDGAYYCPHRPDDACPCRKPKPGLLVQAAREWRVDLGASVMVGDALSDIEAARAAGCRGILLDATLTAVKCHPAGSPNQPPSIGSLAEVPSLVAKLLGGS
jgi:histidinol-phosphate phosphatase family protein